MQQELKNYEQNQQKLKLSRRYSAKQDKKPDTHTANNNEKSSYCHNKHKGCH